MESMSNNINEAMHHLSLHGPEGIFDPANDTVLALHVPLHVSLDSQTVAEVAEDTRLGGLPLPAAALLHVPVVHPLHAPGALHAVDLVSAEALEEGEALQALVANVLKEKKRIFRNPNDSIRKNHLIAIL
jgi:hypothetical protein